MPDRDAGMTRWSCAISGSDEESKKIWLGRKSAFGAMGQINDYMCLDGTIPVSALPHVLKRIGEMSRGIRPRRRQCLSCRRRQHASPDPPSTPTSPAILRSARPLGAEILKLCVEVGGCLTGEHGVGIEKRDLMPVQYAPGRYRGADAGEGRVRPELAAEPGEGVPAWRESRGGARPPEPEKRAAFPPPEDISTRWNADVRIGSEEELVEAIRGAARRRVSRAGWRHAAGGAARLRERCWTSRT